jgi:hypothetical protein
MLINDAELGRIEVSTIPMPDAAKQLSCTYTSSGKVLVRFRTAEDPGEADFWNFAVLSDDGDGFRTIFSGSIPLHPKANGIREMPFADNKRVLLGDYVLECDPDIDDCERAELVPVRYPWSIEEEPHTSHHWSEIIVSPDNQHIAWTMLRSDIGAANAMGRLVRSADGYDIVEPQLISTISTLEQDDDRPGYLIPQVQRGGEVKQFVRGGTAIGLVGKRNGPLTDSVVQDLASSDVTQITMTPGYDETTILSPDERLGIVMSTRGSKRTDPAIFGLLPRPHAYASQGLIMYLYMYAVAGVRRFRRGNVGPVLIEVERSMHERGYRGVQLHDPEEEWVYLSPMSWHPDGTRAVWPEMVRGSGDREGGAETRIRRVTLHDYQPRTPVPVQPTPEHIPYGIVGDDAESLVWQSLEQNVEGKIAGAHSGYVDLRRGATVECRYVDYSDDGLTFLNGFERMTRSFTDDSVFEADLVMTGEQEGEMRLRATFSQTTFSLSPRLLFDTAEDGRPKSHGYSAYGAMTLDIGDMAE